MGIRMGRLRMMVDFTPVKTGFWSLLVLLPLAMFSPAANATVDTDLSIGGGVRIGWASDACAAGIAGAIRYNSASSGTVDLCNGSNWITVGPGGGSIDGLSDGRTDYVTDFNLLIGTPADAWAIAGGKYNVTLGQLAGDSITTGDNNIAIGYNALTAVSTASYNLAIGVDALTLSTGGNNTAIGYSAGSNITTGTNNIMIGYDVDAVTAAGSNQLNIGNTIYGDLSTDYVGIGNNAPSVALDVTGDIEYTGVISDVSDLRLKDNIVELDSALGKIMALNPVSFTMKSDPDKRVELGFIAQDVEKIFPELVITARDEQETKSLNYTGMIAPMVQAMQEQQRMLEAQQAQIDLLVKQNAELKAMMEEMRK